MDINFTSRREEVIEAMEQARVGALNAIGSKVVGYASGLAPVDTGLLRNSLTYALDGESPVTQSYHAAYGENRNKKTGKRMSAKAKGAGAVGVGHYSGTVPKDPSGQRSVVVGTNVKYAA